jgi:hypothetical protein
MLTAKNALCDLPQPEQHFEQGAPMMRNFLTLIFTFTAASASAIDLPWQHAALNETPQYCEGFVTGGLASREVGGVSRTDLWLAWSYVIRSGTLNFNAVGDEYQAGWDQFQNTPGTATAQSVVQKADGECGLGRTGHQITGW